MNPIIATALPGMQFQRLKVDGSLMSPGTVNTCAPVQPAPLAGLGALAAKETFDLPFSEVAPLVADCNRPVPFALEGIFGEKAVEGIPCAQFTKKSPWTTRTAPELIELTAADAQYQEAAQNLMYEAQVKAGFKKSEVPSEVKTAAGMKTSEVTADPRAFCLKDITQVENLAPAPKNVPFGSRAADRAMNLFYAAAIGNPGVNVPDAASFNPEAAYC